MKGKEQKYINNAFDTNWIATVGPTHVGVSDAAVIISGTAAIHLAYKLLKSRQW